MTYHITCLYCDYKWEVSLENAISLQFENCPKCKDHNVKIKSKSKEKIDYYKGSPEFPGPDFDDASDMDWGF